jgi:hypothetical protein
MSRRITTPSGTQFSHLTLMEDSDFSHQRVLFQCDCGNEIFTSVTDIKNRIKRVGHTSCRNCASTKHGLCHIPEYQVYHDMIQRCYNSKSNNYRSYGAKGVRVCDRWLGDDGFNHFYEDMGQRPPDTELDKDGLGDGTLYSPDTCQWITKEDNNTLRKFDYYNKTGYKNVSQTLTGDYKGKFMYKNKTYCAPSHFDVEVAYIMMCELKEQITGVYGVARRIHDCSSMDRSAYGTDFHS